MITNKSSLKFAWGAIAFLFGMSGLSMNIERIEDKGPDSVSFSMRAIDKNPDQPIRRILSLDGGGIRGLYEITALAVLEEIIKNDNNNDFSRISDLFDVAGGTSTGSILAAGLFYRGHDDRTYSAIDMLKLYAHFGYKIFDEQKRFSNGIFGAKYYSNGVDQLLEAHFAGDRLQNTIDGKQIFIVGFDTVEQKPAVFSTTQLSDELEQMYGYHNYTLVEAIGVSTAAPLYFPSRQIMKGRQKIQMKDGGLVANNPAYLIYQEDSLNHYDSAYEIYSFGTGQVPEPPASDDIGYAGVGSIISEVFGAQVSSTVLNCQQELRNRRSGLNYFVRLQNLLEEGMGEMDDTRPSYVKYAMGKGFALTKGNAFRSMVEQLGLTMPDDQELDGIFATVRSKLNSLSSINYDELTYLEKEWLLKKIMDLDFEAYAHLQTFDGASFDWEDTVHLFTAVKDDLEANSTYLDNVFNTKASYVRGLIEKGAVFHDESRKLEKFTLEQFNTIANDQENAFADALIKDVKLFCNGLGYTDDSDIHLKDLIHIYLIDRLSSINSELNERHLTALYQAIFASIQNESRTKSFVNYYMANKVYHGRAHKLKYALRDLINKRFPSVTIVDDENYLTIETN